MKSATLPCRRGHEKLLPIGRFGRVLDLRGEVADRYWYHRQDDKDSQLVVMLPDILGETGH
jgi:hypothetical protein